MASETRSARSRSAGVAELRFCERFQSSRESRRFHEMLPLGQFQGLAVKLAGFLEPSSICCCLSLEAIHEVFEGLAG